MNLGRYLINAFTAQDGYEVRAPEEIRVVEITTKGWCRVIWDIERDQSWERADLVLKAVIEQLPDNAHHPLPHHMIMMPPTVMDDLGNIMSHATDPRYPSLTTALYINK